MRMDSCIGALESRINVDYIQPREVPALPTGVYIRRCLPLYSRPMPRLIRTGRLALFYLFLVATPAIHAEPATQRTAVTAESLTDTTSLLTRAQETVQASVQGSASLLQQAGASVQDAVDQALDMLGIPYRRGGSRPDAGFDCSGFVSHVFNEAVGLVLPRSSRELSQTGSKIDRPDLRPGDLVFFNTMRRAFSHVGIYVGNGQFVHSPRAGGRVRVEDMGDSYWKKRYNGARRVEP